MSFLLIALVSGWLTYSANSPVALSARVAGAVDVYIVQQGDTLAGLGARYGLDASTLARQNGLGPESRLAAGSLLIIDNRHIVPAVGDPAMVINIPQRMLFWLDTDQIRAYPAALGRPDWQTPTGSFSVTEKRSKPVWEVSRGDPWIGTSFPVIGIHGTNNQMGVYSLATQGSIRLRDEDVCELFEGVSVGAKGEIVYQPALAAFVAGRVFVEVHPDVYRKDVDTEAVIKRVLETSRLGTMIDWQAVARVIRERDGVAHDVTAAHEITVGVGF